MKLVSKLILKTSLLYSRRTLQLIINVQQILLINLSVYKIQTKFDVQSIFNSDIFVNVHFIQIIKHLKVNISLKIQLNIKSSSIELIEYLLPEKESN